VERRFGWDTHGLPVEYEIDKKLGITVRIDKKLGITVRIDKKLGITIRIDKKLGITIRIDKKRQEAGHHGRQHLAKLSHYKNESWDIGNICIYFFQGPDDVAKMGIEAYNNECRSIVTR
jgi:hypothetical protein